MSVTISQQLVQMKETFEAWSSANDVQSYGVQIVPDLVHLWNLLLDNSQASRILIMYNGEQVRGEFGIAAPLARVDRRFIVVISRGRTMTLQPGDALVQPTQNAAALYDDVEDVRDICRAMIFDPDWCERPTDYIGVIPVPTENTGRIVDAYQIEFSVGTNLELIVSQPDSGVQTG